MLRIVILTIFSFCLSAATFSQGSRILAPNYPDTSGIGVPGPTNNDFAWLEHDSAISGNFLDPSANASERVYVHLKDGETLRYGIRRIAVRYDPGLKYSASPLELTNEDLSIALYNNAGTIVQATHYDADVSTDGSEGFLTTNGSGTEGIISTVAESLIGPEFVFNSITYNSGGYTPLEYTNNSGTDQPFYISFIQADYAFTTEAQLITDIGNSTIVDANKRSWYDLWDFTVYDGPQEKKGRLYSQRWNFTAQYGTNRLADEFLMYIKVPSTIGGQLQGNYVKKLDIGGLDPFSLIIYANSEGSDGSLGDTNGDGVTDFQDFRQGGINTNIGYEEYDIFVQNPDINIWPTTTLPSVSITDAVFYCNAAGTGGEASLTIESNQVGYVAFLIDLNGVGGYQGGTKDVIIEAEIATEGSITIRWDGLDGLGAPVPSGTPVTIAGRFTAGAIHVPMVDVEESPVGINMLDVRPSTSFDLIYWDDSYLNNQGQSTGSSPESELDGTNADTHLWNDNGVNNGGNNALINTWSFGYYQVNTQNVNFTFVCDVDGDGIVGTADLDSDNDGVPDATEGAYLADADGDNIPDYLDSDFAGFVDSNGDGINDNFDTDLDGIPDALDADNDNDGIPDLVENGLTDANLDGTLDEGSGITDVNLNGLADIYDPACDGSTEVISAVTATGSAGVTSATFAQGAANGTVANITGTGVLTLDFNTTIASGTAIAVRMAKASNGGSLTAAITQSIDNTTYTNSVSPTNLGSTVLSDFTYTLTADARYLRITRTGGNKDLSVDNATFSRLVCSGVIGTALVTIDTDGDGVDNSVDLDSDNDGIVDVIEAGGSANAANGQIANFTDDNGNGLNDDQEQVALSLPDSDGDGSLTDYLDIDSDNDGILDNIDSQDSENSIATAAGDTDGDGLLDVYDPNNGGTLLTPVDTDSDGTSDHLSSDADGDGVPDYIEGWDSDRDGFSNLDTDKDGVITDETGYNADADSDGLWDIFESSTAPVANTDGSGKANWQDTDDDNDGILTSGEDSNNNNDWTDDKTQGQGAGAVVPDYLYRGDYDGDSIPDSADADSDNDGILDSDEDNGETIDPSGDEDGDGIANYQDTSDATVTSGLSSTADVNGDGTYDVYDTDFDGMPDFLDLDSDNDGLWDAIEADGGSVPNGLNTTTGQFALQDPDNDGLMNYVDTDDVTAGGVSDLANPDSDGDGIKDYIDIDSDGDGITDIIEAQSQSGFIALTNLDSDGDGIDNAFDPTDGGVLIDPVNSDGVDLRDYLDTDSDNDTVLDVNEGDDANQDGYGDWDTNTNHDITDEAGYNTDADGDGLADIFDTVTAGTIGNETGSNADLPNTDAIDFRNWRDSDDDNDGTPTKDEDANSNGNLADDQTGGQSGSIPDYLYHGDFDRDGIPDASDGDSDNDGIPDTDEDGGEGVDPSADADGDGIPNFRDSDDPGLSSTVDSNGDGVYDVFDADLDGIPDFRDRDSDNDGTPDLLEAGGTDADGDGEVDGNTDTDGDGIPDSVDVDQTGGTDSDADGIDDAFDFSVSGGTDTDGDDIIDSADLDIDGDGILNTYDADNGGTPITLKDSDGDGLEDIYDLDSDNDGITDLVESGGTDTDGDGKLDDLTDTDLDGFPDLIDADNGGTALTRPDSDRDGILDFVDVDSDNDGIPDTVDNGGPDSNNDGRIDSHATDTDGDGLADAVDPDNGGTPISNVDTDGDGISDYLDLDADNDGYPDILEAGGTDSDFDGVVDNTLNSDSSEDTIPDNVDVDQTGGTDSDGDEIDDAFDIDFTGGTDTDGDGIDDAFDTDANGDGFDDDANSNPYGQEDKESDGFKDFRDLDSDGDGIVDALEMGFTADASTGQISGFADTNNNGWNDAQEGILITPTDTDSDGYPDYQDIDADNDGLPDNIEGQTKATYTAISDIDTDNDGLDDAYDPDNGGSFITPASTDGGDADYLDTDSDGDTVPDNIEGDNDDRSQYADWDTNSNNDITDETGYNVDSDRDGLWDIFDTNAGNTSANVTGSTADGMDTDSDGIWDFQDVDDDGDGTNTSAEDTGTVDGDPTNDFAQGGTPIPDYLYGDQDLDGDGVSNSNDLDSDNDGLADDREDGGTGIDPSGDIDGDGLKNFEDPDMDGDSIVNTADTNGDGSGTNTTGFKDANGDGVIDQFDKDLDGVPDFLDHDSDNDGIADIIEFGLTDANKDGTLDEGAGITDLNSNGIEDQYDAACAPCGAVTGTALTIPDTDGDGIANHQDLDADNDGIPDNIEAQPTATYTAPAAGDADADGILDVYDEDIAVGNALVPENTDAADTDDYIDTDSDNDGVLDFVEAYDANMDGFSSLDTDRDGLISDQSGYSSDSDADGIRLIFDNSNGRGTLANITGTTAQRQDTDGDGIEDWRDNDDDGDGTVTGTGVAGSGEDYNSSGTWSDDFTQGGGAKPDYLYNPDVDGDGVADHLDLDSDQDGVLNTVEYAGAIYAAGGDPFDDNDGDGIYNYLDTNDAGNTSFVDVNGDGIDDQVDQDRDGIPNFFDLDSDNDGIMDAIEANGGVVPTGFNTTTGRFGVDNSGGDDDDDDNDGLNDNVDTDSGGTALANTNTDVADGDTLNDFLDLDSDNDGITDHVEAQTTVAKINPSGLDSDADGLDDAFDGNNGGTAITPINTDGTDNPDYRDTDSDNDNDGDGVLLDLIEGYDANRNGFSELDTDLDGLLSDETGYNVDSDNDGLWDLFDSFSGRGTTNTLGSKADLQDTDSDGKLDFRDQDDDGDALTTAVEDINNDGNWTNDKAQGGGATPDYLYFNDSDNDRIADGQDQDGDNDGILDDDEYDATLYRDPFGDQDGDGIFNYNDSDDPTDLLGGALTDSNGDGIWDVYDWDLDGNPNFFDLDSDNDGIPDIVEAGGVDTNNDGKLDGISDTDGDGIFDNVDVDQTGGTDANLDGIDDAFQDGTDTDGDGIEDTADFDADGDGIINVIDPDEGGTPLANPDSDGDGVKDIYDFDSDNDGIVDLVEAGGSDSNGDGKLDSFGDTDGDGWGNVVDSDNGGTAHPMYDSDSDLTPDYLQLNSDGDAFPDWDEGFDDDEDDDYLDDYESRRVTYETANGSPGHYPTTDVGPANGIPDYLDDADGDGRPNFLDPDNATYYRDSDNDGIVDFFDPSVSGTSYANISGAPDNDADGIPNYRDGDDTPLPLDWISFDATYNKGDVDLVWVTVNEVDVSHFDIEHSLNGKDFKMVADIAANNLTGVNIYTYTHKNPVSGINFYRLNQIDFDGRNDYSWIRVITASNNKISFVVYPNPTSGGVSIKSEAIVTGFYQLIDITGKSLLEGPLEATNEATLDLEDLKPGVYQLRITTPDGTVHKRIVKK